MDKLLQKIIGLILLVLSVLGLVVLGPEGDGTGIVVMFVLGLYLLLTKQNIID